MKVIIYVVGWGDYKYTYYTYSKPALALDVQALEKEGYEIEFFERFDEGGSPLTQTGNNSSDNLLPHLREVIVRSIEEDALVFMQAPDMIFGAGSLYNMVKLAQGKKDMCIAVPHLRINAEKFILENKTIKPSACSHIVDLCFKYLHQATAVSFDHLESNGTWAGISIRQINGKDFGVIASMPTIHLAKFNKWDFDFWNKHICMGHWDRGWAKAIYQQDRLRVIGSSDVAFCGELTRSYKNNVKCIPNLKNNDKMGCEWIEPPGEHNKALRKFYFILRRS